MSVLSLPARGFVVGWRNHGAVAVGTGRSPHFDFSHFGLGRALAASARRPPISIRFIVFAVETLPVMGKCGRRVNKRMLIL